MTSEVQRLKLTSSGRMPIYMRVGAKCSQISKLILHPNFLQFKKSQLFDGGQEKC